MKTNFDIQGNVAVVTGGAQGIGRGITEVLGRQGCTVIAVDRDAEAVATLATELNNASVFGLAADVTNPQDVTAAIEYATAEHGGLDFLVNNAGILGSAPIALEDTTDEEWQRIFNVNVRGTFLFCKEVVPIFKKAQAGKIINIASRLGKQGAPNYAAYSSSKFATIGLTQALALELAPFNVNVNAICPGDVLTPLQRPRLTRLAEAGSSDKSIEAVWQRSLNDANIALGRQQTVEDIGLMTAFLCSEGASNVTAQSVNVTGGLPAY